MVCNLKINFSALNYSIRFSFIACLLFIIGLGAPAKAASWQQGDSDANLIKSLHSDKGDGGGLEQTTKAGTVENMANITLLPNAIKVANTYYVDLPPRILIEFVPGYGEILPKLDIYDLGRQRQAGTAYLYQLSQQQFCADLPNLSAGVYELQLKISSNAKPILKETFAMIKPARKLNWEQTLSSPFGLIGVIRTGPYAEAPFLDGPALGKMMGVHAVRGGIGSWLEINTQPGSYQWNESVLNELAKGSLEYGLVCSATTAWTPGWAVDVARVQAGGGGALMYPAKPEFQKDFAEFCRQTAQKTKGVFRPEFEMWNESNNEPYGSWKGTFEEFVERNHIAADAVLSVNPDARMILGTTGGTDAGYIARLLKAGLAKKFRIVDVHPYRCNDEGPEDGLLEDIRRVEKVIDLYGNNQSIIFSEIGWPTYTVGNNGMYEKVTRFQQACYLSRSLLIGIAAGVERIHVHMLPDWGKDPTNPEFHFGVVDINSRPKLSLSALSTTHRHLEQTKFKGVVKGFPDYHHVWSWDTPWTENTTLLTIWCDTRNGKIKPKWINLPANPIVAEDLWAGDVPKDRLRKTSEGYQVLPGEDPLFIYIPSSKHLELDKLPAAMRPWHLKRLTAISLEKKSINVDGNVSEWTSWPGKIDERSNVSAKAMGYAGVEEGVGQQEDNTAKFSVGYNDEGLFIAASIKDDTPMQNSYSDFWIWCGDNVRLYISTVDSQKYPFMTENHFSLAFAPVTKDNGQGQVVQLAGCPSPGGVKNGDLIPGAKVVGRIIEGGWAMEGMIPWGYFGTKPSPGDVWEFDISVGGRTWNGGPNNWCNPLLWGELQF